MNKLNTGASAALPPYSMEQQEYNQRKLDHYNKWLKKNFASGKAYPGFPEDKELLKILKKKQESVAE